ncbi:MAG: TetR/AcrR family transcriptional regulator [Pseudomonadota bacterium]
MAKDPTSANPALTSKGSATRERIVQAARKQLVDRGYEAFVMRDLADALHMKLGNLQYYFKTRETLILHLIEREAEADIEAIRQRQQDCTTPAATFRAIVEELVVRWRGQSGILFSTLTTLSLHNPVYRQLYRQIYATFYTALEQPVRQMNPELSAEEARLRVRLITALIDGSSMQIQVGSLQVFLDRLQTEAEQIALA